MKLTERARQAGVHPKTARRWFHQGVLPAPARQLRTGTIPVETPPEAMGTGAALYARVSSWDQKADLDRQLGRLSAWAARQGLAVVRTETEVGSGLAARRRRLMRLLADPTISTIVVEHRDRLARSMYGRLSARNRALRAMTAAKAAPQRRRRLTSSARKAPGVRR